MRYTLFGILVGAFVWALFTWAAGAHRVAGEFHGAAMGVEWSVKARGRVPAQAREEVSGLLERLDQQMSNYRLDSDLSRFNDDVKPGEWYEVPPDLCDVLTRAQRVSEMTRGAFDVTIAPVVDAWGFGRSGKRGVPEDVESVRQLVDYKQLELTANAIRKTKPGVRVDLGGIGKGFAAERIGQALERSGVKEYLVAIGGDLRARGSWRVGIEVPNPNVKRVLRTVELKDASLSTSGDYRNFFEQDGVRYSHGMNPKTGWPAGGRLASVSVIHPGGAEADGLATGLFVMGAEAGMKRAEELQVAAVFVERGETDYVIRETSAWRKRR